MATLRMRHARFVKEMRREAPRLGAMARAMFDWLREPSPYSGPEVPGAESRAETLQERHQQFIREMRREGFDPNRFMEGVVYTIRIDEAAGEGGEAPSAEEMWAARDRAFDELLKEGFGEKKCFRPKNLKV